METKAKRRLPRIFRTMMISFVVLLSSVLLSLFSGELALRLIDDKPAIAWRNWLDEQINSEDLSKFSSYDSVLGWRLRAGLSLEAGPRQPAISTGTYGLRFTTGTAPDIALARIVAVGDSFTFGSEVNNDKSWPAFLEGLLGQPVLNGGVGGWGTDQILLRGEQFIELLRPEILLVGFLATDIERAGLSIFSGGPKPYFKIGNDTLVHYNNPVPSSIDYRTDLAWYDRTLSYSYIYYRVITALAPNRMIDFGGQHNETVDNDPVEVTCKLLERAKVKADQNNVRMILLMQYGADIVRNFAIPPINSRAVIDCARRLDLQVVDEFPSLHTVALQSTDDLKSYYVMRAEGTAYGHMSAKGNRHVAKLIATAIKNPTDGYAAQAYYDALDDRTRRLELGKGRTLLGDTAELEEHVGLTFSELTAEPGPAPGNAYLLKGVGGQTEHYLSTGLISSEAGDHAFSVWLDPEITRLAVLQLKDRGGGGGLVSVDLATSSVDLWRMKNAEVHAWIDERRNGWVRVAISGRTEQDAVYGILQLVGRNWSRDFAPDGEAIRFAGMRLERLSGADRQDP